jgi:diguanylate cyclase (GGDEF)-like protein/PAS domain S-box-containing protein
MRRRGLCSMSGGVSPAGVDVRGSDGAVPAELPMLVGALSQPDAFRGMLDSLADGVYLVDRGRRILFWNEASERISGYAASEVVGHRCFENILRHVDCTGTRLCNGLCPLACTMRDGAPRSDDLWLHHRAGQRVPVSVRTTPIRDDGDEIIGAIEFFTDGSRLQASEEQIAKLKALALTDPLTGLPNRRFAELSLSGRLAEVRRHHRTLGVVFADIDRFKIVNDTYGHDVGDDVLRMVAGTLSRNVRRSDSATRFGGEEFVLLLPDADPAELCMLAERLCMLVRRSSIDLVSGGELSVTISMGATLATAHDDVAGLLHRADQLLYRSKHDGRDRVITDAR